MDEATERSKERIAIAEKAKEYYEKFVPTYHQYVRGKDKIITHVHERNNFPFFGPDDHCLITAIYVPIDVPWVDVELGLGPYQTMLKWRNSDEPPIESILEESRTIPEKREYWSEEDLESDIPFEIDETKFKRIIPFDPFIYPWERGMVVYFTPNSSLYNNEYYVEWCHAPEEMEKIGIWYPIGVLNYVEDNEYLEPQQILNNIDSKCVYYDDYYIY